MAGLPGENIPVALGLVSSAGFGEYAEPFAILFLFACASQASSHFPQEHGP
jgi:hypothetical protein